MLKDWCINCISLSEFFTTNKNYSQSQYLLDCGLSLLPEKKKKKLHATFYMSYGKIYLEFLKFTVILFKNDKDALIDENISTSLNAQKIKFDELKIVNFKEFFIPKNFEDIKKIFRLANTQYKKALEFFVLDGYVTEHVNIQTDVSSLYKYLGYLEKDPSRNLNMLDRRRDILETIYKQLNPKAYQATWQVIYIFNHLLKFLFSYFRFF